MDDPRERQEELERTEAEQQEQQAAPSQEDNTWQAKADEYLDKYRRSVAEFSNYRKRQDREREAELRRISAQVLRRILPALDDLDRALGSVPDVQRDSPWVEGVRLIERKLNGILQEFSVETIAAVGKPFDPRFHSALMRQESDTYPEGTVVQELQRGYMLGDEVLRPTVVSVSAGPGPAPTGSGPSQNASDGRVS